MVSSAQAKDLVVAVGNIHEYLPMETTWYLLACPEIFHSVI